MHWISPVAIAVTSALLMAAGPAAAQSCQAVIGDYNAVVGQKNSRCADGAWRKNTRLCLNYYDAMLSRWEVVEQYGCGDRSMYRVIRQNIEDGKNEIRYVTDRHYRAREDAAGEYLERQRPYNACMARVHALCGGQGPQCVTNSISQCANR